MQVFRSKFDTFAGTSYPEIIEAARSEYHAVQKRTPRRVPYVRSTYFKKDKIFLSTFWDHLNQKSRTDRVTRLKFYACAIDLLRNTRCAPDTISTYVNMNISLHRFYGQSKSGGYFCVQIKENKTNDRKDFMSVLPR